MGEANKGKSNKNALSWSAGEHMTETQLELDEERGEEGYLAQVIQDTEWP